jgi:hypothetical protein
MRKSKQASSGGYVDWEPPTTAAGHCLGWQAAARGRISSYSGPPILTYGPPLPEHLAHARYAAMMCGIYDELNRQIEAGELGPGPIAVTSAAQVPRYK